MDRAELAESLTPVPKLAHDGPVQFHLVNLAGHGGYVGDIIVGVGIGTVKILMRPWGNAKSPGSANLIVNRLELQIVVEDLDSPVASVANVDVALCVGCDCMGEIELAPLRSFGPHRGDVPPVLVVFDDPRIAISIGDENVPGWVPRNIGRPVECIRLRRGLGSARRRRCYYPFNRFGPPAKKHYDSPLGIELDNH